MTTRTRARVVPPCKVHTQPTWPRALYSKVHGRKTKEDILHNFTTHWDAFGSGGTAGIEANSAVLIRFFFFDMSALRYSLCYEFLSSSESYVPSSCLSILDYFLLASPPSAAASTLHMSQSVRQYVGLFLIFLECCLPCRIPLWAALDQLCLTSRSFTATNEFARSMMHVHQFRQFHKDPH